MTVELCPHCGVEHDAPFSADVLALARRILRLEPSEERAQLLMELADQYTNAFDSTDLSLPEDLHAMAEAHLDAKAQAASVALRLGRFLLRAVGTYDSHREAGEEEMPDLTKTTDAKKDAGLN